ncbi:MAG: chemotaxis protein CheA [Oscillospiraceae bacterium]|jgi:two-component system chemotaxis sensor kinase CheA|nr:chemotaxis protein CheA [Oscillospiraceae bacterium]MCI1990118.1 chemotaxis protein CheA [Oscillospiraceae bacterium]MCI2034497.1 chemotaxis protein CheA [Oscillospiraceae bacterium]
MDNGTESMLDVFLFETDDLLEHLDDILLACEKNKNFDPDSVNEIFRIMHTIKGSSAMMQFNSLTVIAHKMEDLFSFVREKGVAKEYIEDLIDLMFRSSDFLKAETEKVRGGQPLTTNIGTFEQEINDFLKKISGDTAGGTAAGAAPQETARQAAEHIVDDGALKKETAKGYPFAVRVFFDEESQMANLRAFMLVNDLRDIVGNFEYSPDDIETNPATADAILRDGFFLFFAGKEDAAKALPVIEHFTYTKDYSEITPIPAEKGGGKAAAGAAPGKSAAVQTHAPVKQSLINVNLSKLDNLMDLMGEIVITESMVTSNPALQSAGLDNNFTKASRQLRKLTDELQEIVMSIRMVPVSTVFQKMRRIVRDMNKKLEKDAHLVLIGEETEVDKTIVDSISDPIMHLVRNSMDHGIEPKAERIKAGKPEEGTVTLSAQNTGGDILISVTDDGAGIDRGAVLEKAQKKGLLTKPAAEYTDQEVYQFLLMPGFSTNEVVTEYSGRGVGMDVVKENVEKIGGEVSIESTPGRGTKTTFKIPLTLAIINGMKISVGGTMFTIPIKNIRQSFKASDDSIMYDTDMHEIIMVRDKYYPLIRLHQAYKIDTEVTDIAGGIVILVGTHDNAYCIFADALLGEQQVVVKTLPTYLNQFRVRKSGIDGCAILGDGSISLILNVQNLYNDN